MKLILKNICQDKCTGNVMKMLICIFNDTLKRWKKKILIIIHILKNILKILGD